MKLLRRTSAPNCFRVDFSKVKRARRSILSIEFGGPPAAVVVDARAIGEAVSEALEECPTESVRRRRQPWNDYQLYLNAEDHDDVRRLEGRLVTDLVALLEEKLLQLDADPIGPMNVRILVDDAGKLGRGEGMLWGFHAASIAASPPAQGEITVRFDRAQAGPGLRLVGPFGELELAEGRRVSVGRADPDAGADHLVLPGADEKINRQQLWIRVAGNHAEIGRIEGKNPVSVGRVALQGGAATTVTLPVEIDLSNGRMRLMLTR